MGAIMGIEGKTAATLTPVAPPGQVQDGARIAQLLSENQVLSRQLEEARAEVRRIRSERIQPPVLSVRQDDSASSTITSLRNDLSVSQQRVASLLSELDEFKARAAAYLIEKQNRDHETRAIEDARPKVARLETENAELRRRDTDHVLALQNRENEVAALRRELAELKTRAGGKKR